MPTRPSKSYTINCEELPLVSEAKDLGIIVDSHLKFDKLITNIVKGGCEEEVRQRIKSSWMKWKDLSGVLCDKKMPVRIKGKVYKTMIRPVLIYGAETWALKRREEEMLERTEMRMLRWILGVSLKDRKRNDFIRNKIGVTCITNKIRESRLRW